MQIKKTQTDGEDNMGHAFGGLFFNPGGPENLDVVLVRLFDGDKPLGKEAASSSKSDDRAPEDVCLQGKQMMSHLRHLIRDYVPFRALAGSNKASQRPQPAKRFGGAKSRLSDESRLTIRSKVMNDSHSF